MQRRPTRARIQTTRRPGRFPQRPGARNWPPCPRSAWRNDVRRLSRTKTGTCITGPQAQICRMLNATGWNGCGQGTRNDARQLLSQNFVPLRLVLFLRDRSLVFGLFQIDQLLAAGGLYCGAAMLVSTDLPGAPGKQYSQDARHHHQPEPLRYTFHNHRSTAERFLSFPTACAHRAKLNHAYLRLRTPDGYATRAAASGSVYRSP